MHDLGLEIPEPSQGDGIWFDLDSKTSFALELKKARKEKGLTQIEVARRLKIAQPNYQKLEDPTRANPSLSTVKKVEKAIGKKILYFS